MAVSPFEWVISTSLRRITILLEENSIKLGHGPRINNFRPAIDPLFQTAARHFGQRVIGVILSGGMSDGTLGLAYIKSRGGLTVVQDPQFADVPDLPLSAIRDVQVDHIASPGAIAEIILEHSARELGKDKGVRPMSSVPEFPEAGTNDIQTGECPSNLTCPSCGGALWERDQEGVAVMACHVGHKYSENSYLDAQITKVEDALWTALRALKEQAEAQRRMAARVSERGPRQLLDHLTAQVAETEQRAEELRQVIIGDRSPQNSGRS